MTRLFHSGLSWVWFFWVLLSSGAWAQDILFRGVTVIDPWQKQEKKGDLLMRSGRIVSLNPKMGEKTNKDPKLKIIDAQGKWILPGLVDLHVHSTFGDPGIDQRSEKLTVDEVARRNLFCGVTAFLDLMGDMPVVFQARKQNRKDRLGARMFVAGPMVTAPGGHGAEFGFPTVTLTDPASASKAISALALQKPDVIKLAMDHSQSFKNLDFNTLKSAISKAHELKIPTVVHIGTWQDAQDAVAAGTDVVTHLASEPIPEALLQAMKKQKILLIPTMTYQIDFLNILENRSLLNSVLLSKIATPSFLESYQKMDPAKEQVKRLASDQAKKRLGYLENLKKIIAAGIDIAAGTDAGDLGVFQGFSLHREIAIYQQAGMTPWQVIKSATSIPKQFLHLPLGILPGEFADFVLLRESPLVDIQNTQTIEMVVFQGKVVDRDSLLNKSYP